MSSAHVYVSDIHDTKRNPYYLAYNMGDEAVPYEKENSTLLIKETQTQVYIRVLLFIERAIFTSRNTSSKKELREL